MTTVAPDKGALKVSKKVWKGQGKVPSNLLHARVSYLYQAATYLATQQQAPDSKAKDTETSMPAAVGYMPNEKQDQAFSAASRRLLSDLRDVALKQTIRVSSEIKNTICKNCDSLLIEGRTCSSEVENKSKNGKKPWADVFVRKCNACGALKRFPLAERQKRRPHRPVNIPAITTLETGPA